MINLTCIVYRLLDGINLTCMLVSIRVTILSCTQVARRDKSHMYMQVARCNQSHMYRMHALNLTQ